MACRPLYYGEGFVRGVLNYVDCQAQNIGSQGYQALAAPGSVVSVAITGLLTLFVAIYGYRMLLGHTPSAREGVMALAKIGIVLALASSWPAYRALFYDVVLHGPADLASDIGRRTQLPGADAGLVGRLQGVDEGLIVLDRYGVGVRTAIPTAIENPEPTQASGGLFEPWAMGTARIIFLTATIASLASVRLVSGLLLALGPFFIAFLLFSGTRGLFEGWIRGLAGAALGAVAVTLILGAELALIEPWIAYLIQMRQAKIAIFGAPVEIFVVMSVFALALIGALAAAVRVATGFRIPRAWREAGTRVAATIRGEVPAPVRTTHGGAAIPAEQRSRAATIVEAVSATQRREMLLAAAPAGAPSRGIAPSATRRDQAPAAPVPLGQDYGRRARTRLSGSAGRRDQRS